MHVIYTGERVRLRPFADEREWCDVKEEVWGRANDVWGPIWAPRREHAREFEPGGLLEPGKPGSFAVERLDTGELVGWEEHGLHAPHALRAWVGTFIREGHRGRGFGVEAKQLVYCYLFENYPISQIEAHTVDCHRAALRGLHLSGMRYAGRSPCFHCIDGRYYDLVSYTIHREEWLELPLRRVVRRGAV